MGRDLKNFKTYDAMTRRQKLAALWATIEGIAVVDKATDGDDKERPRRQATTQSRK